MSENEVKKKSPSKPRKKKPVEKPEENKVKFLRGIVKDCKQLNIRAVASPASNIIGVLNRGDGVLIDQDKSEEVYYCIKLKNNKFGFCMKKYIAVL